MKKFRFFVLMTSIMALLAACSPNASNMPTPTPLPQIASYEKALYTVELGSIVSEVKINAEVVPSMQDELFFRTAGYVTRVTVKRGDIVKKGDLLGELQVDDLLNQLEQARIDLEVAQANLAQYTTQHEYDVKKAESDVIIWQKRVELARLDLEDAPVEDQEKAQLNLEITAQNLVLAEEALKLETANVNPYMEQAVKRSTLAVERLEGLLAERQIVAPYDCQVMKSSIRPGQKIDAYFPAFGIGEPANLVLRSTYDYEINSKLHKGSEVRLYIFNDDTESHPVEFLPNFIPTSLSTSEKTSATDFLYFALPQDVAKEELPIGKVVSLRIILGQKDDALLLPRAAIREYKGLYFVIVQEGDRRRRVEINEIGLKSSERWEVIADLEEGDQVVGP